MKITDGKKTVKIEIKRWNGSGYDPDWSNDYFVSATLPYNEETDTYTVEDVNYCIDMATNSTCEEGGCSKYNEDGDIVPDEDMCVFVEELN